jgi:hypothetical protein
VVHVLRVARLNECFEKGKREIESELRKMEGSDCAARRIWINSARDLFAGIFLRSFFDGVGRVERLCAAREFTGG